MVNFRSCWGHLMSFWGQTCLRNKVGHISEPISPFSFLVFVLWDDILKKWTKYEENGSSKMAYILIMPESIGEFQLFSLLLTPKLPKTLKQAPTQFKVDWFLSNWS